MDGVSGNVAKMSKKCPQSRTIYLAKKKQQHQRSPANGQRRQRSPAASDRQRPPAQGQRSAAIALYMICSATQRPNRSLAIAGDDEET